jgi:hypothetical protein
VDLSALLTYALPVFPGKFPNWRDDEESDLLARLAQPYEGIYFDIEYNGFWWPEWGTKPEELIEALQLARAELAKVPKLIPVYSHRYMAGEPYDEPESPVFSVMQTDIIVYGIDLPTYLATEFGFPWRPPRRRRPRTVPFWSALVASGE